MKRFALVIALFVVSMSCIGCVDGFGPRVSRSDLVEELNNQLTAEEVQSMLELDGVFANDDDVYEELAAAMRTEIMRAIDIQFDYSSSYNANNLTYFIEGMVASADLYGALAETLEAMALEGRISGIDSSQIARY
jgi:hypothetical protein